MLMTNVFRLVLENMARFVYKHTGFMRDKLIHSPPLIYIIDIRSSLWSPGSTKKKITAKLVVNTTRHGSHDDLVTNKHHFRLQPLNF